MDNEKILPFALIIIILFAATVSAGFIIFGNDVFARELSEEQVQSIVNNIVNEGVSDSSEMVTVGTPTRASLNGASSWRVPVSYNGRDSTRKEMLNGDVIVPVKARRDEDNNYVLEIIFADGSTMEVVVTPNGSIVNINTPGVLPAPLTTITREKQQPETQSTPSPTPSGPYCHICESSNCVHIEYEGSNDYEDMVD